MPELPEVEVLVRHLAHCLAGRKIQDVAVRDHRSLRWITPDNFRHELCGARIQGVERRGKYLVFTVRRQRYSFPLIGHLGMTGRLYLAAKSTPATRHTTIELGLGRQKLVFEDLRRFGGMTLDPSAIGRLGPEPLEPEFTTNVLVRALHRSKQPIKIKLMDQSAVAGIGNIYASEALFLASIHPATAAASLDQPMIRRLRNSIRRILREAIKFGSTLPLDFGGVGSKSGLFYYGTPAGNSNARQERLRVYDRTGEPCTQCGKPIRKLVQAARSTFYCPVCQPEL